MQAFAAAVALVSAAMLLSGKHLSIWQLQLCTEQLQCLIVGAGAAGFYIHVNAIYLIAIRKLTWASFMHYTLSGLFQIELRGQYPVVCAAANEMGSLASPTSCAPFGDQVLGQIGMHDFGLGVAFGAQLGFYALWVSLGYLALLRLKERR